MCGIAGFVQKGSVNRADELERMTARLVHRGPDDSGTWIGGSEAWSAHLGHRRLSIIDLESGRQPMENEDGKVRIVFNGEIYNFGTLREELLRRGHRFATRSDTEAIIHHYEEKGLDGIRDLDGMFAFAIWDGKRERLVLARDRAGIKPLYYTVLPDGGIAFASELTSVLRHSGARGGVSREALASYFFCDYVSAPLSMVSGVRKLEPGHVLVWENGRVEGPRPYWRLEEVRPRDAESLGDRRELAATLLRTLRESVRSQLASDVPLGVFLSGGIDSSLVAALAQQESRSRLRTFSIAFEDPTFDESSYARLVARGIGSEHVEETLNEGALVETLPQALAALDEPMADPSIVPTYLLSRLAARHVKVALGGDGGDELWGGYPTYRAHQLASLYGRIPGVVREKLIGPIVSGLPIDDRYQSLEWKAKRFIGRWDDDRLARHLRWMSATDLPDVLEAFPGVPVESIRPLERASRPAFGEDLNSLLALDFQTYLPGSVLTKVDRASMAHGLEVRPPMLGNDFIDFAFSLPSSVKTAGGKGKLLLKQAARGVIPDAVIDRPKKGFGIPLARWLRGPLSGSVDAALRDSPLWEGNVASRRKFQGWAGEHKERVKDHSKTLWALVVLDHWMKREGIHVEA